MSSVHFVCVGEDLDCAEALADVFDEAGLSVADDGATMADDDVAVLVWSEASARSPGFMNTAQQMMDEGRAVIASFVSIADASNIGAPVFDLSDWNLKSHNEPALVPLIYAAERLMPSANEGETAAMADVEDATFEDVDDAPLEMDTPVEESAAQSAPAGWTFGVPPKPAPEPRVEPEPEPEPEPLVAAEVTPEPEPESAAPPVASPSRVAKAKPARREKPKREEREKQRAPRRAYVPPPPGRLRAAMPFLAGITACIAAVFVFMPLLAGGARTQTQVTQVVDADMLAIAPNLRASEIAPQAFAEFVAVAPTPVIRLAAARPARAERSLLQLASATETPRPRRARTPRNITSWDTPDPKRRGYLQTTGAEAPAAREDVSIAPVERKPKPDRG